MSVALFLGIVNSLSIICLAGAYIFHLWKLHGGGLNAEKNDNRYPHRSC